MQDHSSDKAFAGSIPVFYEAYLVPLIFEPYARDLATRAASESVAQVLEIAAGTGVVTRELMDALDPDVSIVSTDLNDAMLNHASSVRSDPNVEWRQADALDLPFDDASFDAVLCQFGVMFFPDRARAYAEARRVLRSGGRFIFSTWDNIGENELADVVTSSLAPLFPEDPPRFLARTPHGYSDFGQIAADLRRAGFSERPSFETLAARSKASDPSIPAVAYCQGTPLRNEIESRDPSLLQHATDVATAAVSGRFGPGAVDGKIQAHVVCVRA